MKKITNVKWMRLLKVLHLLGMALLCAGLLWMSLASMQQKADIQLIAWFNLGFMRSGGVLLVATALIYHVFTRYGFKGR